MYVADAAADAIQNEFGEETWARGTSCEVICEYSRIPIDTHDVICEYSRTLNGRVLLQSGANPL